MFFWSTLRASHADPYCYWCYCFFFRFTRCSPKGNDVRVEIVRGSLKPWKQKMPSNIAKSQLLNTQQKRCLRYAVVDVICFLLIGWEHEAVYAKKISYNAEKSLVKPCDMETGACSIHLLNPFDAISQEHHNSQTERVISFFISSRSRFRIQWDRLFPIDTCQINYCNWLATDQINCCAGHVWYVCAIPTWQEGHRHVRKQKHWETQLWQIVSKNSKIKLKISYDMQSRGIYSNDVQE